MTLATVALAGCGQSPESIVASTQHCSQAVLSPDLMMRLSSYAGYPDSTTIWVVQACHPTGTACSPVATYDHAPPPVYTLEGRTLTVELLGGNLQSHVDSVNTGGVYRVVARHITGNVGVEGVKEFYKKGSHRCPASNQQYPG